MLQSAKLSKDCATKQYKITHLRGVVDVLTFPQHPSLSHTSAFYEGYKNSYNDNWRWRFLTSTDKDYSFPSDHAIIVPKAIGNNATRVKMLIAIIVRENEPKYSEIPRSNSKAKGRIYHDAMFGYRPYRTKYDKAVMCVGKGDDGKNTS